MYILLERARSRRSQWSDEKISKIIDFSLDEKIREIEWKMLLLYQDFQIYIGFLKSKLHSVLNFFNSSDPIFNVCQINFTLPIPESTKFPLDSFYYELYNFQIQILKYPYLGRTDLLSLCLYYFYFYHISLEFYDNYFDVIFFLLQRGGFGRGKAE